MAPPGRRTRPTADRVKEAIFDMAAAQLGVVGAEASMEGLTVLDLFAGSGGLGIEALSRGATEVVLVDESREAVDTIRSNLTRLGWTPRASPGGPGVAVVRADVLSVAPRLPEADLVLADPPYEWSGWGELLGALPGAPLLVAETSSSGEGAWGVEGPSPPGEGPSPSKAGAAGEASAAPPERPERGRRSIVSSAPVGPSALERALHAAGWAPIRSRRYGATVVTLARPASSLPH